MVKKRATKKKGGKKLRKPSKLERGTTLKGDGFWSGTKDFLKKSHLISNVGKYVLPAVGSAAGSTFGTAVLPGGGTLEGGVVGAAAGSSVNDWIKSHGYGKKGTGKNLVHKRTQFATGKRGGSMTRSGGAIKQSGGTIGRGKKGGTIGRGKKGGAIRRAGNRRCGGTIGRGYSSKPKVHLRTAYAT